MQFFEFGLRSSRKRFIHCIVMLTVLFAFLWLLTPGVVCAAGETSSSINLKLSSSLASPGDSVTASGIAEANTWVTIKVVDSTQQNIVVFDGVKSGADGTYSCTFKVPFVASGKLTVVVGYGSNVATGSLNVSLDGWWPEEETDVTAGRVWNIKFSKAVKSPLSLDSIYVAKDMNGHNKVSGIEVNSDKSDLTLVKVGPPAGESWESEETYYLFITTDVESASNDSLESPVKMKFRIAGNNI